MSVDTLVGDVREGLALLELNPLYAAMVPARIADVKKKLDRTKAKAQ